MITYFNGNRCADLCILKKWVNIKQIDDVIKYKIISGNDKW